MCVCVCVCVCVESKIALPLMNKPIQLLSVFPQQKSGGAGMAHVSEVHSGLRDKSSPGSKNPKAQTVHHTLQPSQPHFLICFTSWNFHPKSFTHPETLCSLFFFPFCCIYAISLLLTFQILTHPSGPGLEFLLLTPS